MSSSSGEKTEQPTAKKRKQARKQGNIPKSKDFISTINLVVWVAISGSFFAIASQSFISLIDFALTFHTESLDYRLQHLSELAFDTLVLLSLLVLLPIALIAVLGEFLQTGAIFTLEKVRFSLENINPISGIKRVFSENNLVESIKNIVKTVIIFVVAYIILMLNIDDIMQLPNTSIHSVALITQKIIFTLFLGSGIIFLFLSVFDIAYQHYANTKQLRMTKQEVKQEHKDSEGDPMIKSQRKRMHRKWAQESAKENTRGSRVLVVNPTHVAVALGYDEDDVPVPVINAMGEDEVALSMREVAEDEGIPVLRNITLARALLEHGEVENMIPPEFFDIVAEVVVWAQSVRERIEDKDSNDETTLEEAVPGEDLTVY